jgi:hypothetical protein
MTPVAQTRVGDEGERSKWWLGRQSAIAIITTGRLIFALDFRSVLACVSPGEGSITTLYFVLNLGATQTGLIFSAILQYRANTLWVFR